MGDKKDKKKDPGKREIKQVFLSEDGKEEKSVTTSVIRKDREEAETKKASDHKKEHTADHAGPEEGHHISGTTRTLRIVAVAVSMFFSLMLAMGVGVGLALWDSNRTISELGTAMFGMPVEAATYDTVPGDGEVTEPVEGDGPGGENLAGTAEDQTQEEDNQSEDVEEDDYGMTLASEDTDLSKAGSRYSLRKFSRDFS